MKAFLLYEAGGPDKLVPGEAPKPTLKKGEVLVKVKAIGINPADTIYRNSSAFITALFGEERPVILGWDISGEIVEKTEDSGEFAVGDAVFALLPAARGYAEFVAVNAGLLARKPENISFEEAAATPMACLTAWQPLIRGMKIKKGDKVLIHAASGGVGHFAVQIAKYLGAEVMATSSAKNRDFVISLGADKHIDYRNEDFWEVIKDIDFVLDTVGGETLEHSIDVVNPGGTIISILGLTNERLKSKAKEKGVNLSLWGMQGNGEDLRAVADLMSKGIIKVHIAKEYPFSAMAEAHTQVETRRTAGKIVLTV
ncbi:NADP-dependent oxidoreductase [Compostibacter hankyongensis]